MAIGAVKLVPQLLLRQRVLAHEEGAQLLVDNDRDLLIDGAVQAVQPAIGLDLQIERADCGVLSGGLRRVGIRLGPQFVVDVQRIRLILLVDSAAVSRCPRNCQISTAVILRGLGCASAVKAGRVARNPRRERAFIMLV